MMRIRPISSTVTLLMAAIVFGAPIVVNLVMAAGQAGKAQPECVSAACLTSAGLASAKLPTAPL
jgi:hypothetical protein